MSVREGSASADVAVRRVLDAIQQDADTRPLVDLLDELARSLVEVIDCRCVAISVGSPDGRVECLATAGDRALAEQLFGGPLDASDPLSDVTAEAVTVVLPSAGRTSPHPALTIAPAVGSARLGVPVLLRGRSAGGIFLAEPHGSAAFSDADVQVVQRAALGAATVIERVRTVVANRRRDSWYELGTVLAREIVENRDGDPLQLVVDRVAHVASADVTAIVRAADVPDSVVITAAAGTDAARFAGTTIRVPPATLRSVLSTSRPVLVEHIVDTPLPRQWRERLGIDASLAVPLSGSGVQHGLLVMARSVGAPAFTPAESGMAMLFASTIALALELSESQAARDQVALTSERGRIARDLHDHVIQRLYALGLSLQSMSRHAPPELGERLSGGIDTIDETIAQLRSTILRLSTPILATESGLRARVALLIDELQPVLGFVVPLTSEGPVDFAGDESLVDDCLAVVREALTNVARHAGATRATVTVRLTRSDLLLEVTDDGRGVGDTDRRSGLANMRTRAESRGGSLDVASGPGPGTTLRWTVPNSDLRS